MFILAVSLGTFFLTKKAALWFRVQKFADIFVGGTGESENIFVCPVLQPFFVPKWSFLSIKIWFMFLLVFVVGRRSMIGRGSGGKILLKSWLEFGSCIFVKTHKQKWVAIAAYLSDFIYFYFLFVAVIYLIDTHEKIYIYIYDAFSVRFHCASRFETW